MLFWAAAAVCGLLLAEIAVRVTVGAPRPERLPLLKVEPDPVTGYRPVPGNVHYGYDRRTVLNRLGLRGPEVHPRRPGEHRIALLGETQIYGLGIADEDLVDRRLCRILGRRLAAAGFTCMNLAVRAFGLAQQVSHLERLLDVVDPDRVVVFFYLFSFGQFDVSAYYQRVRHREPWMLDLGGALDRERRWRWRLVQAARRSALVAAVHGLVKARQRRSSLAGRLSGGAAGPGIDGRLRYVEAEFRRLAGLARDRGFAVSVAVLPFPWQLASGEGSAAYQGNLRTLAEKAGFDHLDLLPALSALARREGRAPVAPFDDHYDASAHRAIAEAVAAHLKTP